MAAAQRVLAALFSCAAALSTAKTVALTIDCDRFSSHLQNLGQRHLDVDDEATFGLDSDRGYQELQSCPGPLIRRQNSVTRPKARCSSLSLTEPSKAPQATI